jgi:hypothetical protein
MASCLAGAPSIFLPLLSSNAMLPHWPVIWHFKYRSHSTFPIGDALGQWWRMQLAILCHSFPAIKPIPGFLPLSQCETFDLYLEIHSGSEYFRSPDLTLGLCQVWLCLCDQCWEIGLWLGFQVVISTVFWFWWLWVPALVPYLASRSSEMGFCLGNSLLESVLVCCFGHAYSLSGPVAC